MSLKQGGLRGSLENVHTDAVAIPGSGIEQIGWTADGHEELSGIDQLGFVGGGEQIENVTTIRFGDS